jgi:hypothetical protein
MMRFSELAALLVAGAVGCSSSDGSVASTSDSQNALLGHSCNSNEECGPLLFCSTDAAESCHASGVCAARVEGSACARDEDEVCACDGKTYANACVAHAAGTSVVFDGVCGCDYDDADIDGDTLAESAWADRSESYFYTFVGNGTLANDGGTFTSKVAPPCTRDLSPCDVGTTTKSGTFVTRGSTLELHYENGDTTSFHAQRDCANHWRITGRDYDQQMNLGVTSILP